MRIDSEVSLRVTSSDNTEHKHEATLARQAEETRPTYSDLSIDTVVIFRGPTYAGVAVAEAED